MLELFATLSRQPDLLIYVCVAGAVMMTVEAIGLALSRSRAGRSIINRRLALQDRDENRENVLIQLRRERGLNEDGSFSISLVSLNRLLLQSGIGARSLLMIAIMLAGLAGGGLAGVMLFHSPLIAALLGLVVGMAVPLLALMSMRSRRRAKFGDQLPEALDVLVRSMRAGHPLPVAVTMVAREMPDPIGTEFGMTADEMTFGLDLETSLQNMCARVGQQDLPFLVVAVSIQSKTGGNLAEVLSNLSRVIRERFKLRRRVKSMSAEGRMSAAALSLIPLVVFLLVNLFSPSFYGSIKDDPIVPVVAAATFCLWALGIFIIYRLVNFKY